MVKIIEKIVVGKFGWFGEWLSDFDIQTENHIREPRERNYITIGHKNSNHDI